MLFFCRLFGRQGDGMSNQLRMAKRQAIQALHRRGWSQRRIAREVGVSRDTVARYVALNRSNQATAPPGSGPAACSNQAIAPTGSERASGGDESDTPDAATAVCERVVGAFTGASASDCEPYREHIVAQLARGLSAKRIHQDLADESDISYWSVRRFVQQLRGSTPDPFRRMECEPGEEAQIDFGTGAMIVTTDGKRKKTHVLRVVLSHSRKAYSEAVDRQTTENFIRVLENSFRHFAGVPRTLVIDNLRAAVTRADWYDPDINPKVLAFCEHYGTTVLPTRAYTPRHKGKVESGVKYIKNNALKGRTFGSIEEQNAFLRQWEATVADTRIHGTTRKQVKLLFETVERAALQRLTSTPFPFFHEGQRKVHRDGHVEVQKAYYSVPPEWVGRTVWIRWDSRMVRIFDQHFVQLAVHSRCEPGRFSTADKHIPAKKITGMERGTVWLLRRAAQIGQGAAKWSEAMLKARGIEGVRVLQGLLSLTDKHESSAINQACETALSYGAWRLRTVRNLIDRTVPKQKQFEGFLDEHPIIRSLSEYDDLVKNAIRKDG